MLIFTENPISFKMVRKSQLAARLSSSISRKLLQFLGNYTDGVLAEYITVLVCNGKHQYQARDDLEAFLGERSGEFISWLWNFLMKCRTQSNINEDILISQHSVVTSPEGSGAEKDVRTNRLKDFQNCGNGDANEAPTEDAMFHCLPLNSNPLPSPNMEFSEGSQRFMGLVAPIDEVNATNVTSKMHQDKIRRKDDSTKYSHYRSLSLESSEKKASFVIPGFPAGGEQSNQHMDKYRKVGSSQCNNLPGQHLYLPVREPVPRNLQSNISEDSPKHILATDGCRRSFSLRATNRISHQIDRPWGSVWDRLGKPCESTTTIDITDEHVVRTINQVLGKQSLSVFAPNEIQNKSCDGHNLPIRYRKAENVVSAVGKIQVANITQKRHFGEISTGPGTDVVHLTVEGNMNPLCKPDSQDLKKSNVVVEAPGTVNSALFTAFSPSAVKLDSIKNEQSMVANLKPLQAEMLDVKGKLHQIEKEMVKLGSKWAEMKKDGKSNLLSNTSGLKHSGEDVNSRTVFVTNVHFAATKDALSKHFAKCGVVLHVVILTDKATSQAKGSAYVTFASKEAVDKAVALSGTSFLSRTMKIVRKSEVATATSVPGQFVGKHARLSSIHNPFHSSTHLQWRRGSVSIATEPSISTSSYQGRVSARYTSNGSSKQ